ncbi:hypothetical protein LWC35_33725 [Pseudonocardia kujensis]|uniref:hypothetical protein n=1 Tax=Pseudonocardia kujensis TaxID=1128675 RepID=UPI001E60A3DD|nr:hypothetical protein [Pseudonocardia kujensis]MCE0767824.1 hypothetical protein [Pseudonocardia kujensis]
MRTDLDLDPDGLDAAAAHAGALGLDLGELAWLLHESGDDCREIGRVVGGAADQVVAAAETFRRVAGAARRAETDAARALG